MAAPNISYIILSRIHLLIHPIYLSLAMEHSKTWLMSRPHKRRLQSQNQRCEYGLPLFWNVENNLRLAHGRYGLTFDQLFALW